MDRPRRPSTSTHAVPFPLAPKLARSDFSLGSRLQTGRLLVPGLLTWHQSWPLPGTNCGFYLEPIIAATWHRALGFS